MQVTVVIPTYNRAHTLGRALDSVRAQTRPADEILVVDDGSGDDTARLLEHYPNVRRLKQAHSGVSAARNRGIMAARGEWIALLDSDDEWLPDKLAHQCRALERSPEYRIAHGDEIWIRHGRRVNPKDKHAKAGGRIFRRCLPLCAISPSAAIIHRELFDEVGLFDESLPACEDYDLWLRITARDPVLYIDRPLIKKYGGHADQLSRQHWGMDRFRITALEKIINTGELNDIDRRAALETLNEKLAIVKQGAVKRNNSELAQCCAMKQSHYKQLLKTG